MLNKVVSLTTLFILADQLVSTQQNVCRAIAFSGGGSKGAFEAGVVYGLNHAGNPADFAWDVVSGVSAGALNSGGISLWAPSQGIEMSEWMEQLWLSLTNDQVYKEWPNTVIDGLFNKAGFFDNSPLLNLMTKLFNEKGKFQRQIVVSAVDVNTGKYQTFDNSLGFDKFPTAVVASASIPFIFPHRDFDGYVLMDGSTAWNTNLASAVDECKKKGFADSSIILDIILCGDH